jgi:hypothetical protein
MRRNKTFSSNCWTSDNCHLSAETRGNKQTVLLASRTLFVPKTRTVLEQNVQLPELLRNFTTFHQVSAAPESWTRGWFSGCGMASREMRRHSAHSPNTHRVTSLSPFLLPYGREKGLERRLGDGFSHIWNDGRHQSHRKYMQFFFIFSRVVGTLQ